MSIVSTGGLGYLLAITDPGGASASAGSAAGIVDVPIASAVPAAPAPAAVSTLAPATAPPSTATAAPVAPVVVNGQSFDNKFGTVQVQVAFAADGTIAAVDAIQVPGGHPKSVQINDYAVPRLNGEVLTIQNAGIDTVSGATYTSIGYAQSLQSAIDIAVANGIPVAPGNA